MKKKICLLLCVLIATFSFVGCSGKKDTGISQETLTMAESTAEYLVQSFSAMGEEGMQEFLEMKDFDMNLALYSINASGAQYGYPELNTDAETFVDMIKAWQAALEECGSFRSFDQFVAKESNGDIVVSAIAKYENREADIVFTFDKELGIETFAVSAHYSTGEILKKAGLNTLLGMGAVFLVLILLAFIISLMKYIPVLMDILQGKKVPVNKSKGEDKVVLESVDETDDLELVAVITAAIAASEGTSSDGFVVRSIRRRPNNNWK